MKNLVESNPKIMFGKPVIKGTRITVELVLEKIAEGFSVDEILSSYPHLTREQILACVDFARKALFVSIAEEQAKCGNLWFSTKWERED